MSQQEAKWYVVHTYSGYENKVKEDLEKSVENAGLSDIILEVKYPTEETIEILPTGKRKTTTRKVFPGYVMVKMLVDVVEKERPPEKGGGISRELVMNPRAWYVIRNTRGVTGFVGPGSKPVPLTEWAWSASPSSSTSRWARTCAWSPVPWRTSSAGWRSWTPSVRRSSSPCPCSAGTPPWSWILSRSRNSDPTSPELFWIGR